MRRTPGRPQGRSSSLRCGRSTLTPTAGSNRPRHWSRSGGRQTQNKFPTYPLPVVLNTDKAGKRIAFVCAVDMPFLAVELIDDLARRALETNAEVVLPWDGQDHFLAAVYRTDLADRADALVAAGERRMSALVDASDAQRIVISESRPLTNVNTDAELGALTRPGA